MSEVWAEVFIELLPAEHGGRQDPLNLSNDIEARWMPHLRVVGGSGQMLGVAIMDGPDQPIPPGGSTFATIKCLYDESEVPYKELIVGAEFEILEGSHVVGRGRVTQR